MAAAASVSVSAYRNLATAASSSYFKLYQYPVIITVDAGASTNDWNWLRLANSPGLNPGTSLPLKAYVVKGNEVLIMDLSKGEGSELKPGGFFRLASKGAMRLAKEIDLSFGDAMKSIIKTFNVCLALAITLGGASMPAAAQTSSACSDSTSTLARGIRNKYGVIVSRNDSVGTRWRTKLGLPALSNAQVHIVGDTAVCRTASQAYDGTLELPFPSQAVIVLELGTLRMVVKDIGLGGGALLGIIFDQSFANVLKRLWL